MKSRLVRALVFLPVLGFCFWTIRSSSPLPTPANAVGNSKPKVSYQSLVASLDERIRSFEKLVEKQGEGWLLRERLVKLLSERGSLTGNLADFQRAQEVLDEAFRAAPQGSGPLLIAARMNYSIHRLAKAESYLNTLDQQALIKSQSQIASISLKANLAFHRGNYEAALNGYHSCEMGQPGVCVADLAIYHANTAGFAEAEALLANALSRSDEDDPHQQSWLNLQLGILMMKQGRYEEALSYLQKADTLLPGWWLIREHIAETYGLLGDRQKAVGIYEEVVRQTGLPQYMDALSETYEHLGRKSEAEELYNKAEKAWEAELAIFPEAATGHAIGHYLRKGKESDRALELARKNYEIRPGGEASVLLAQALLLRGKSPDAAELIARVLLTPYRSAELYDIAAQVAENQGDSAKAEMYRGLRQQMNPRFS